MKASTRLLLALLVTAFAVPATGAQMVSAAELRTTPSLTGEQLSGTTVSWKAHCNADGTGKITYKAKGSASGPYAGSFRESGAVSVTKVGGTLYENFSAEFDIRSTNPEARIEGKTSEIPPETFQGVQCQGYPVFGYTSIFNDVPNGYQAEITRNDVEFNDRGTADTELDFGCTTPPCIPNFMKGVFASSKEATLTADD
jgi:hypothetical protein